MMLPSPPPYDPHLYFFIISSKRSPLSGGDINENGKEAVANVSFATAPFCGLWIMYKDYSASESSASHVTEIPAAFFA